MNLLSRLKNNKPNLDEKMSELEKLITEGNATRKKVFAEFDRYVARINELDSLVLNYDGMTEPMPLMLVMLEAMNYAQEKDKAANDDTGYYAHLFLDFLDLNITKVNALFSDNQEGLIRVIFKEDDEGEIIWYKYRPNIDTKPISKSMFSLTNTLNEMMLLERYRDDEDESQGESYQSNGFFQFALDPKRDYSNLMAKNGTELTIDKKLSGLRFITALQKMALTMITDLHYCIDDCLEIYDLISTLEQDNKHKFIEWLHENHY